MRKKILYGILFLTLFLISTASMVQPVAGYERGIPDEAIGVEQVAEVKIYNEDEWEKCLGKGGQDPSDIYSGDGDVVGARQLTIFREIEDDEEKNLGKKQLQGLKPLVLQVRQVFAELNDPSGATWPDPDLAPGHAAQAPPLAYAPISAVQPGLWAGGSPIETSLNDTINDFATLAMAPFDDFDTWVATYTKKHEMSYLTRDKWFFNEDWETDEDFGDPDKADLEYDHKYEGWGPISMDPRELIETLDGMAAMKRNMMRDVENFHGTAMAPLNWFFGAGVLAAMGGIVNFTSPEAVESYIGLNDSIAAAVSAVSPAMLTGFMAQAPKQDWEAIWGPNTPNATYGDLVMFIFGGLDQAISKFYHVLDSNLPFDNKAAMAINLGNAGLPTAVPSDDFVTKLLDLLDVDDETLYSVPWAAYGEDGASPIDVNAQALLFPKSVGGETVYVEAYYDIELEGSTITVEIEWPDDTIDPKDRTIFGGDNEDELKDFEVLIGVGDNGGIGTFAWMRGDTTLWQKGGVDQIPGYEITILLGVSAISVLALVYVIMKKRKR